MYVNASDPSFVRLMKKYENLGRYTTPVKRMTRKLVGREAEMRSVSAAMERAELSNVILLASAGSGKAFDNDTEIPVADSRGYVRIGDIRIGDIVFDDTGNPTEVIGVYPQGQKNAYKVTFSDGSELICCDEHLWNVRSHWQHKIGGAYSTMSLGEIIESGVLKSYTHSGTGKVCFTPKWYVPANGALERDDIDLPVDPYVVGALIGDGYLSDTEHDVLVMSSNDAGVLGEVASRLGALGVHKSSKDNYSYTFIRSDERTYNGKRVLYLTRHEVFNDAIFECVNGCKSVDKRIPALYMLGSVAQRRLLLQGLMDTDGCVTGSENRVNCSFSTKSEGLAHDVVELANSLGMRTSLHVVVRDDDSHNSNPEFDVFFAIPFVDRPDLFLVSVKRSECELRVATRDLMRGQHRYDDVAIINVEALNETREMTCIRVAAASHLFQAGRCHIVTHNTALVQGLMMRDKHRVFLEADLSRMIADAKNPDELGNMLKRLFDEASRFGQDTGHDIVLFMDEFHQIVQLSAAAVEALKPLLADSATRGIRVIAATTYEEFRKYISDNQPLVERLQRINVPEPDKATTVEILKGMAERYGVADDIIGNALYEAIYDVTQRHIPANAQPRKSILVLDAMVGWHRSEHRKFNNKLLADVIFESEGINIAFSVNPSTIKKELDHRVLAQDYATRVVEERLQLCVAGLNDMSKPQSSFLLCGPTGVGKAVANSTPVPAISPKNGELIYINHGDLKPGDTIFDRYGKPTKVVATFPHKDLQMYRVTFSDGRVIDAAHNHLWSVYTPKLRRKVENEGKYRDPYVLTTQEIIDRHVVDEYGDGRKHTRWFIPMNEAVDVAAMDYVVDPYVVGAFIGNGCMTADALLYSGDDVQVVNEISSLIDAHGYRSSEDVNYNWYFEYNDETKVLFADVWDKTQMNSTRNLQTKTLFGDMPEIFNVKSAERRIPEQYMRGSIEQRWALIQGLFDTDGSVSKDDRVRISYSTFSEGLAQDIVHVLFSLGISSRYMSHTRMREDEDGNVREMCEYIIRVRCAAEDKPKFFRLARKRNRALKAMDVAEKRTRVKKFGMVGITSIEPIGVQDAQCIYVDNDEHLYQVGEFVVTHNTELTKQLSNLLFGDATRSLIRIDMSEYANADSLERFRLEITARVWEHPYCIVLLDEVEKACPEVTRVLLSVLDDARLSDRNGREVSFLNCYFVLTTNAGNEIYRTIAQYESDDLGDGSFLARYDRLIRRSLTASTGGVKFPPELLGRIDCIVPFQPLSYNTMKQICIMRLRELRKKLLDKYGIDMSVEGRVVTYLVEDSLTNDTDAGGARAVMAKLESEVTTGIARFINMHPEVRNIHVEMEGELASENKTRVTSDACVKIKGVVG